MSMRIERLTTLAQAEQARGVVIVIDVIRAFTVAGYAFERGARKILLVRTVEEAQELRTMEPEARVLLAGEVEGRLIAGFDMNNSPSRMAAANVRDCVLIQRTGAGTQGAVTAVHASHLLLCALTNAKATARYARKLAERSDGLITLLPTYSYVDEGERNEDEMCANYLEALLQDKPRTAEIVTEGIAYLHSIDRFKEFEAGSSDFPLEDLDAAFALDRFDFVMVGTQKQWRDISYVEVQRVEDE